MFLLNVPECSQIARDIKRKPPDTEVPKGLGGLNIMRQRRGNIILMRQTRLAGNFKPAAGNSTSIFALYGDDLNLVGVGMGKSGNFNRI